MSVDPRTLGWLSRALTHEMGAVQQYLAQSVLARLWGDEALAVKLRKEADEELEHAERLMQRLIQFGVAPSSGSLPPTRLGRNAQKLLAADRVLEVDAVHLYRDAIAHAERMRDPETVAMLSIILGEEVAHVRDLDSMLNGQVEHG